MSFVAFLSFISWSKNYSVYFLGNFLENWAAFYSDIWSHWTRPISVWSKLGHFRKYFYKDVTGYFSVVPKQTI